MPLPLATSDDVGPPAMATATRGRVLAAGHLGWSPSITGDAADLVHDRSDALKAWSKLQNLRDEAPGAVLDIARNRMRTALRRYRRRKEANDANVSPDG